MIPFRTRRDTVGLNRGRARLRDKHLRGIRQVIPRVALMAALHVAPPLSRGQIAEVPTERFTSSPEMPDSLALEKLELEIAHVRDRVRMTDFWHRLLPKVSLSAGFAGGGDLLMLNPEDRTSPEILRSTFRITFNLPLTDAISDAEHQAAILDLKKLSLAWAELQIRHAEAHRIARVQLAALTEQRTILGEQLVLLDHVARFKQMQFDRGKLEYDALVRARMDILSMRLRLSALNHQFLERADSSGSPSITE